MNSEIVNQLEKVFFKTFEREIIITENLTADDIPEWDSIMHLNLIMEIEEEFSVSFALGELQNLKNIGELLNLIEAKQ